jgi:hydrogenase nickel incorporation protein HypB
MATALKERLPIRRTLAEMTRETLTRNKVLAIAIVGPPGAGKTALVEAAARHLRGHARVGALVLHPAAARDAERASRYCAQVIPVETATPDAAAAADAVAKFELDRLDILLIESVGGIAGVPPLGQHATVAVLSVTGGDDKVGEYQKLIADSSLLILTKAELQRHVAFDRGIFRRDLHRVNPSIAMLEVSTFENTGVARLAEWIEQQRASAFLDPVEHEPEDQEASGLFFG